jgi:hypothetical protein
MSDAEKSNQSAQRDASGRLLPGHSVRSPGRPSYPDWFKKDLTNEAMEHLAKIVRGTETDPKVSRAQACLEVLDRTIGRPKTAVEVHAARGLLRQLLEREAPPIPEGIE